MVHKTIVGLAICHLVMSVMGIQLRQHQAPCSAAENDCDFLMENGEPINCMIELNSRTAFTKWIPKDAKVLEVGARYGQTTCTLSKILTGWGSHLSSVEADPGVWDVLEKNLAKKQCGTQLIKGVVDDKDMYLVEEGGGGYGSFVTDKEPEAGQQYSKSPGHSYQSLGHGYDTLLTDCEGCFANFLQESSRKEVMKTLKLLIVESHNDAEEAEINRLKEEGWTQLDNHCRQRVLCAPGHECKVQDATCSHEGHECVR